MVVRITQVEGERGLSLDMALASAKPGSAAVGGPLPPPSGPSARHLRVADLAVRVCRRAWAALPAGARKNLEDRVFYVIFQKTRVENDAYGWRPPEPK